MNITGLINNQSGPKRRTPLITTERLLHSIFIKAEDVRKLPGGLVELTVKSRELTMPEQKLLDSLFPNLQQAVFKLLSQEAILGCLATESEIGHALSEPTPNPENPASKKKY